MTAHPDVIRLHQAGVSQRKIAEQLHLSRSKVQRAISVYQGERSRLTSDPSFPATFSSSITTVKPPVDAGRDWTTLLKGSMSLASVNANADISSLLNRLSPEVDRATWDWLRMLDPGHEYKAYNVGSEDVPNEAAQQALDAFLTLVANRWGSLAVLHNALFQNALIRGAIFAELVLDKTGRRPLNIVAPDPGIVRFRVKDDPDEGLRWELGMGGDTGEFISLEAPTIKYLPVETEPSSPYGVSMMSSAVFPALFLIGLMSDLRRVVAQQGYPRAEVILILEKLRLAYPQMGESAFKEEIKKSIKQINDTMNAMEPDDTFSHTDAFELKTTSGAIDASSLKGAGDLIQSIERMLVRALKTMPLMMGITDGVSEANANRQWEIYIQGVKSVQHLGETALGELCTTALEAMGIQATVKVRFAEVRAAELLRDSQTETIRLANAENAERLGYMDHDEASEYAVGHPAVADAKEAEPAPVPPTGGDTQEDGDNSTKSAAKRAPVTDPPITEPIPPVTVSDNDLDDSVASWNVDMDEWDGLLEATVINADAA